MKHFFHFLILIAILLLTRCDNKEKRITSLPMLRGGKTFAVPTGTIADQFVLKRFPDAKIVYLNNVLDCAIAVKDGKADAAVYDRPVLQNIAAKNEGLSVLPEMLVDDKYGFAVQLGNVALKTAMDELLAEIKANGTYNDMMKRWFPQKGGPAPMPDIVTGGQNGVFKFGTSAVTEPMSYIDGNRKVVGFDVEFASYVAKKLNKKIEIVDMEFGAMLPALISGKVDMIGAGLSITEERAKKVLFSQCYYPSGIAALVKTDSEKRSTGKSNKLRTIEDIKDKRIGVLLGSIHDTYATKKFPEAEILEYQNVNDMLNALNTGKVDVGFYDHIALKEVLKNYKKLGILAKNVFTVPIAAGFNKKSSKLRDQFNAFLKEIKSNGIYNDLVDRWMNKDLTEMPVIKSSNANGELRTGVVGDLGMPFSVIKDGKLVGFDIELSTRFAASIGKEFVPVDMPFGSLIASISTNKIDLITASMMITDERKKKIDFSEPYFESGVSVIADKANMIADGISNQDNNTFPAEKTTFWERLYNSMYNNMIIEKRYMLIINGLCITILISILSALLGTLFGGLICFLRMSKHHLLAGFARIYINLLRGTPVLVLLMIIYYVVFASVNINPVFAAVFAFSLNFAAYVSEMFRTSIESIDPGQKEAGTAGGFTKIQTFLYIIMPQALRRVLPVYKGEFISLVKMTSIVGYIAVQDLTKAGDIIRSRTFDAFFPLIMAAVIYLIIAWLLTRALDYIEISVEPKRKNRKVRIGGEV